MQRNSIRRVGTISAGVLFGALLASPSVGFWGAESTVGCDSACATCPQQQHRSHEFYDYLETGRQANAMWPYPYVCPERVWAHAPFDVMVVNGWRRQNLLGAHHFDPQTGKLTRAGNSRWSGS